VWTSLPHSTKGILDFDTTDALASMGLDFLEQFAFGGNDFGERLF
jgi:hypothetical protein